MLEPFPITDVGKKNQRNENIKNTKVQKEGEKKNRKITDFDSSTNKKIMEEENKKGVLLPKSIFSLGDSFDEILDIKIVNNRLIVLAHNGGEYFGHFIILFKDSSHVFTKTIFLPSCGYYTHLFCLPQRFVAILSPKCILGYSFDGVLLFHFLDYINSHRYEALPTLFSKFFPKEKRQMIYDYCWRNRHIDQEMPDRFGIFESTETGLRWWGKNKTKSVAFSNMEKEESIQILFYPPNQGLILAQNQTLETYVWTKVHQQETNTPWKFCKRWIMKKEISGTVLWGNLVGIMDAVEQEDNKILFYSVKDLFS